MCFHHLPHLSVLSLFYHLPSSSVSSTICFKSYQMSCHILCSCGRSFFPFLHDTTISKPCLERSSVSFSSLAVIIIIIHNWAAVVSLGRRPQNALSKLAACVLSSARSCRSSIFPCRLSTAWLVFLVVVSCHVVCKW